MQRVSDKMAIRDLQGRFVDLEFPEYQREPNIWSLDQEAAFNRLYPQTVRHRIRISLPPR